MPNPTADYPATLHERTNVSAFRGTGLGASVPTQTELEGKQEEEIYEIQRKLGKGDSSAASAFEGEVLTANGDGTSSWQAPGAAGSVDTEILEALTEKIGGGVSAPDTDQVLVGTAAGETEWQNLSAAAVGLGNVNNTSDANKPISTATQAALDEKADLSPTPITLTDASTIATDASLGREFRVTINASRTMGNPTNLVDGQKLLYRIEQGTGGSRTITWASKFRFGTDVAQPVLSTAVGAADYVGFVYNAGDDKLDCLGWARGY